MMVLYVKLPNGTWRISDGTIQRGRTALRKVTNRRLKRRLWLRGESTRPY